MKFFLDVLKRDSYRSNQTIVKETIKNMDQAIQGQALAPEKSILYFANLLRISPAQSFWIA